MTTTMFHGGTIRTVEVARRGAVLVEDDRVAGVFGIEDDPQPPAVERSLDLEGGVLTPAFCDPHVHLPATGLYELGMDLRGERSADRILGAFRHRASRGEVLFGGNFEDPLDAPLLAEDLDAVVGEREALLTRADMHSCIVSSALLQHLNLAEVPGVDRSESGSPTGYLREHAASEAFRWFESRLGRRQQMDAVRVAAGKAYSKGVAAVHEMFVVEWRGWSSYETFREAIEPLSLKVLTYLGTDEVDRVRDLGMTRIGGDWFLDGSFGSRTAWMQEPYVSPPPPGSGPTGISYRSDEEVFEFFLAAQRAGLQTGVHAIGDAAIEQCLKTWERVAAEEGLHAVRSLGHRIEHFECATDAQIERAAGLSLRASVQPAFDAFWGGPDGLYAGCIGWERASRMNRFRTMAAARGLTVGAGSDSTVTPMDPFLQMKALRTHHLPDERMDGAAALDLTTRSAHALAADDGPHPDIVTGAKADLVWLSSDPATTAPEELTDIEVLGTWIGGRRVWPPKEAEAT